MRKYVMLFTGCKCHEKLLLLMALMKLCQCKIGKHLKRTGKLENDRLDPFEIVNSLS